MVAPLVNVKLLFGAPDSSGRFTGSGFRVYTCKPGDKLESRHTASTPPRWRIGPRCRARNNPAHPCSGTAHARRALRPTRLNWIATVNDERTYKKVWSRCELFPSFYCYNRTPSRILQQSDGYYQNRRALEKAIVNREDFT